MIKINVLSAVNTWASLWAGAIQFANNNFENESKGSFKRMLARNFFTHVKKHIVYNRLESKNTSSKINLNFSSKDKSNGE